MPRTFSAFGDRCFSVCGPRLWNALPPHIKDAKSTNQFKVLLKTYFFKQAYSRWLVSHCAHFACQLVLFFFTFVSLLVFFFTQVYNMPTIVYQNFGCLWLSVLLFHVVELHLFCKAPLICYLAGNVAIQMTALLLLLLHFGQRAKAGPQQLTANQQIANKLIANKLTANNADWLKRAILNLFLLSPKPSSLNSHFVTKSLRWNQWRNHCNEIVASRSVSRGQLAWLGQSYATAIRVSHCNKITVHEFTLSNNIQSFIHTVQQSPNFGILKRSANMYSSVLVRTV